MTREEAIKELSVEYLGDSERIIKAKKMAIQALEQEPCEDAINRKIVIAFISGLISDDKEREKALKFLNDLSSVNPQPKLQERGE